jgi:hypothetical protein
MFISENQGSYAARLISRFEEINALDLEKSPIKCTAHWPINNYPTAWLMIAGSLCPALDAECCAISKKTQTHCFGA